MPAKNSLHQLQITDINNLGYGVGHIDGKVVFVAGAADGDLCTVRIIKDAADYAVGRIEEWLTPSPHRVKNTCQAKGCGGCAYRHISYPHELELKQRRVVAAFRKAGLSLPVTPVLHTGKTEGYRNKAQYPVAPGKEGPVIGFFAPKSHRVTEAAHCPLLPPVFGEIAEAVRDHARRFGIPAYDETTGRGLLRHICLRASADEAEILLTLVTTRLAYPHERELTETLLARFPALVGILLNENSANTNVILGPRYRLLTGRDYLQDTLCGIRLRITPPSFYQVNHAAAELLYRTATEEAALTGNEALLDLYCGIGSIGLSMAHRVREIFGIEIVESAVLCARKNAEENHVRHARFAVGDAAGTEKILQEAGGFSPDVIVLDPPRRGADAETLRTVLTLAPEKLLYISCNPDTLARDMSFLLGHGYTAARVIPVDLFPRTGHVECVVMMSKTDKRIEDKK